MEIWWSMWLRRVGCRLQAKSTWTGQELQEPRFSKPFHSGTCLCHSLTITSFNASLDESSIIFGLQCSSSQGGDPRSKPIFSMAPLKNRLYSVEFDSSVPLLEAFSICVSALTSHKLADIFEIGSLGQKPMKTSTTVQAQVPQRYVSSPPPSPVGRI